jgi:hypothetical protein
MFILLSVCLMSSPGTCREERIDWSFDNIGGMACLVRAQEVIAQWRETHPRWNIERWRCAARGTLPNDI